LYAAYNYPAGIRTRCPYNFFFDASFIYWQPSEDNLELGFKNTNSTGFTTPYAANSPLSASSIRMNFDYKPGFKLGVGGKFDYDDWDMHGEYTWFHNTHDRSSSASAGSQIFAIQGLPCSGELTVSGVASGVANNVFNSAKGSWRLAMDIVTADLGRWYYSGMKLTFRPSLGMRAAFIGQEYKATYTNSTLGIGFVDTETVSRKTHSWALGPQVGLNSNWALGYGMRLFGNGEADLLYTRYSKLTFKETHTAVTSGSNNLTGAAHVKDEPFGALRTHLDFQLGLGWGRYFSCNGFYWDLSACYEFQVFYDQNMFRKFTDDVSWFNGFNPNGNLYVHGLTVSTRFDF
jgi:hypothetical protein